MPNYNNSSSGKMAGNAKEAFASHQINDWHLLKIENVAAASAFTTIAITPDDGEKYTTRLHWIRVESASGMDTSPEWKTGHWVLMKYAIDPFVAKQT